MDSKEIVEELVSNYDSFKKGELKNEPARLLCERIVADLDNEEFECQDPTDVRAVVEGWFKECYNDRLGADGQWGVVVTYNGEVTCVEYTTSEESTWVVAYQLLELAALSSKLGEPAPLPEWFEGTWIGVTQEGAESMIEEMDEDEAVRLLGKYGIELSDGDEPSYRVGYQDYYSPKKALLEVVTDKHEIDRARILEFA